MLRTHSISPNVDLNDKLSNVIDPVSPIKFKLVEGKSHVCTSVCSPSLTQFRDYSNMCCLILCSASQTLGCPNETSSHCNIYSSFPTIPRNTALLGQSLKLLLCLQEPHFSCWDILLPSISHRHPAQQEYVLQWALLQSQQPGQAPGIVTNDLHQPLDAPTVVQYTHT